MAQITRTYTFADGSTAYGSQVESEVGNIATVFNNHDSGTSTWTVTKSSLFKAADGTAAAPSITFTNETTTGFERPGSGIVGVTLLGTEYYEFQATKLVPTTDNVIALGSTALGWTTIYMKSGLVGTPAYTFRDDPDTGAYRSSTNELSLVTGGTLALTLSSGQDAYTAAYADYSATSTITGWTSFTSKKVYYKLIGKLVHVWAEITGVSNATSVSFTLPYTSSNDVALSVMGVSVDNGGTAASGRADLPANSATVTAYPTAAAGTWTNSGTKSIKIQLSYQAV